MHRGYLTGSILLLISVCSIEAPPAPTKTTLAPSPEEESRETSFGLYYEQYLQEVVKLLESDEDFRNAMEKADFDDIKNGKLSGEVQKIPGEIREKLDALKKEELSRLRRVLRAKMDAEKGIKPGSYLKNIAQHLDSANPHSFGPQDLTNLIKAATEDLENYDTKRHADFKQYEMMKDMKRDAKMEQMSDAEKEREKKAYEEIRQKHNDHPKVNHPGSKAQLDEVWKEKDGLTEEEFDPKTFFMLHDVNGDGALDQAELESLFDRELGKVYDVKNPEDDMVERDEEQRRMREHVTKEVDKDGDGLVTMDEFLQYTKTDDFRNPDADSYKSVDEMIEEEEVYTAEELEEFRQMIADHEKELADKLEEIKNKSVSIDVMKKEVADRESKLGPSPSEDEVDSIEDKKQEIADEEGALDDLKVDADEHEEELEDMKEELKEQEEAVKGDGGGMAVKIDEEVHDPLLDPGMGQGLEMEKKTE